eukprot:Pompholyxophrys_sp_v1_NODE_1_length_32789_cov_6.460653.p15 type:complete len:279 gc:universal NODE_1_length_32789_cov_6.460653:11836-12672(+)
MASGSLYGHIQSLCNYHKKNESTNKTNDVIFEISPARMMSKSVYDYCLHAQYFNEYLSYIAELLCWDKVTSGHNHFYYLDDMVLTMNPDGRQWCHINRILQDKYYIHMDLMLKQGETSDTFLKEHLDSDGKLKSNPAKVITASLGSNNNTGFAVISLHKEENSEDIEDSAISEDDRLSLKSNLRLRVLRQVPISPHRFPPYDKFHYIERKAFRTYTNKDVTINFEILRPIECQKKFEELLLPKPESKFVVKIWIHEPKNLNKYLKFITEDGEYKEILF